ncbi:MAG: hypothetical protein RJA44_2274 [Pseudomonadota bacterium]|jgi:hypothetical protein
MQDFPINMEDDPNPLEQALRLAAEDAANRPDFYRLLLESTVFVVGDAEETEDGDRPVGAGENVSIHQWQQPDGSVVIPFFTSPAAVEQAVDGTVSCMGLPARTLFESTRGATLVLNPNNEYGKQFLPEQVEAILAGGVPRLPKQRVEPGDASILLGPPQNVPTRMVDALISFFAKRSEVKAAYMAQLTDESETDSQSRLAIGIHVEAGNLDQIFGEIATVAGDTAPRDQRISLYPISPGAGGLADYFFDHVTPFYENSWGARLHNSSGAGHA